MMQKIFFQCQVHYNIIRVHLTTAYAGQPLQYTSTVNNQECIPHLMVCYMTVWDANDSNYSVIRHS